VSNVSRVSDPVIETIEFTAEFSGSLLLKGHSSYAWSERERRVLLFLGRELACTKYMAALTFDSPLWDEDTLEIIEVRSRKHSYIEKYVVSESDIAVRNGLNKMCRLVECVVAELRGDDSKEIARLQQALYVQKCLSALERTAAPHYLWSGSFV